MGEKKLMKGNEAIAEAAIKAGCRFFFGYPITPQSELPEYLARKFPEVGGEFLQAESEVSAINMVYGCAGAGKRVMTSSSGPGISLKAEGISYIAGAELPAVVVNIMRGGPGLGSIQAAQSDYFQATKGMAHGDFYLPVLAPSSVQEAIDLTMEAFEMADKYRNPVMVAGDGIIGQMAEPVEFKKEIDPKKLPEKEWAATGKKDREKNVISCLALDAKYMEDHNKKLKRKYDKIRKNEVRYETYNMENAEIAIIAYGTTARIALSAIKLAEEKGFNVGLIRPITLFPFPYKVIEKAVDNIKKFLVVEMSMGQMIEDVNLAVKDRKPVYFYGRSGGMVPSHEEIFSKIVKIGGKK